MSNNKFVNMKTEMNVVKLPKRRLYQLYVSQRIMHKIKLMQLCFLYLTYRYEICVDIIIS